MNKVSYRVFLLSCFTLFSFFSTHCQCKSESSIKNSIVKIYTTKVPPSYDSPWSFLNQEQSGGSGSVIDNNLIITSAHVVSDQRFITVRLFGEAKKYEATIVAISHEADLALLTVDNRDFFDKVTPIPLGELPDLQDEVFVFGFPEGGDTLSITNGNVSRIEYGAYSHSSQSYTVMQIDAAVDHGSSGGPVITNGKVVGVVMQRVNESDNISYAVPVSIIDHFLQDLKDGKHNGIPRIGFFIQDLENEGMRARYHLKSNQTGVLVLKIVDGAIDKNALRENDVLLKIDNNDIAGDGTVELRQGERISMGYHLDKHQIGENIDFQVLRNGHIKNISIKAKKEKVYQVNREEYGISPNYYIFGGLVFSPLTVNYMKTWGDEWFVDSPIEYLYLYKNGLWENKLQEHICLIKVLPHTINAGYHDKSDLIIEAVNGMPIINLEHMISLIESSAKGLIEFRIMNRGTIVIDRNAAIDTHNDILTEYAIPKDRSL
ncbi:MAG: trypsin-like peptidase domain-containing protein [Gammaproteobacteria bacterium]|nr:trypsin-like peptidase domain-containing protein [Gammaproteobacteria bacterium]